MGVKMAGTGHLAKFSEPIAIIKKIAANLGIKNAIPVVMADKRP